MTRSEKLLYHQIHPLKLLTDVAGSFASTWLLWKQDWWLAAVVGFAPSIAITCVLLSTADLAPYMRTPLGRYVQKHMTRRIEALRFFGQTVMWAGAALHIPWLIPYGFVVIAFAWLNGLIAPRHEQSAYDEAVAADMPMPSESIASTGLTDRP